MKKFLIVSGIILGVILMFVGIFAGEKKRRSNL